MSRRAAFLIATLLVPLTLPGCETQDRPPPRLKVRVGIDPSLQFVEVRRTGHFDGNVWIEERPDNDAVVRVNGVQLERWPNQDGCYTGAIDLVPVAGEDIALEVQSDGLSVTGYGELPETPVLTTPANGATLSAAEDLVVEWTSGTSPDRFYVTFNGWDPRTSFDVPGTERTITIPSGRIASGDVGLCVDAYDDGNLLGDYAPADTFPGMNVRAPSSCFGITVQ